MNKDLGASASPSGSRASHEAAARLHPSGFDPSRGMREQVFERIRAANGCVEIVCADYLSDNCVCMDDYEKLIKWARRGYDHESEIPF